MNLNLNSIVKDLEFFLIDKNHVYFSYDSLAINENNKMKFKLYIKEPTWYSYNINDTSIYNYYFLNGTILQNDESNVANKTKEFFFKNNTSMMYGPDFYTEKSST